MPQASLSELSDEIMNASIKYIDQLVQTACPNKLVYIAIDGLCPRAKLVQQRKRRYVSAWRRERLLKLQQQEGMNTVWDSNIITPGTTFMDVFNSKIAKWVDEKNANKSNTHFMLSDSTIIGEGEHKIFKYIKDTADIDDNSRDVVYGLDADLIMLGMLSPRSDNICLLRERPEFHVQLNNASAKTSLFLMLNIDALKTAIHEEFKRETEDSAIDKTRVIKDYILLCALLGNDFLPSLSYMKIKFNAIDHLIKAYCVTRQCTSSSYLISDENELNNVFLGTLLSQLAKSEDVNMTESFQIYMQRRVNADRRRMTPLQYAINEIDNWPSYNKSGHNIDPSKPGWRIRYYETLFKQADTSTNTALISDACANFARGIEWVWTYYTMHDAPMNWYYMHSYSPTIMDLSNYYTMVTDNEKTHNIDKEMEMKESKDYIKMMQDKATQMIMVMPPQSWSLLPTQYKPLITDPRFGCVHYFPIEFKMSTFLKLYLWECTPMLPDMNLQHVYKIAAAL